MDYWRSYIFSGTPIRRRICLISSVVAGALMLCSGTRVLFFVLVGAAGASLFWFLDVGDSSFPFFFHSHNLLPPWWNLCFGLYDGRDG